MKTVMTSLLFPFSTIKRAYKILLAMLGVVPVLYIVYFSLTMTRDGLMLSEFLYQNPWNSILFLVVLLNIAWLYILFKIYPDLEEEEGKEYVGFILWILFISQLLVTNVVFAIITAIAIHKLGMKISKVFQVNVMLRYKLLTTSAASLIIFSSLCGFAVMRVTLM